MRILAIDPGYDRLGIAVLEGNASRPTLIWSDCITPAKGVSAERLAEVSRAVTNAIKEYSPDILAIETLFFNKNIKTAVGVAEARGAILAAAGLVSLMVVEYSPQQERSHRPRRCRQGRRLAHDSQTSYSSYKKTHRRRARRHRHRHHRSGGRAPP